MSVENANSATVRVCWCGHAERKHSRMFGCDISECDCIEFNHNPTAHVPAPKPDLQPVVPEGLRRPAAPAAKVVELPKPPRPADNDDDPEPTPAGGTVKDPDDPSVLIAAAKRSSNRRLYALGHRVEADLGKILDLVREERAKAEAEARHAAEVEKARADVARLEEQLKQAKARLRGNRPATVIEHHPKPVPAAATKPATDRIGGIQLHPCGVDGCDRQFDSPQGASMHRRRAHEGFDPNAAGASA